MVISSFIIIAVFIFSVIAINGQMYNNNSIHIASGQQLSDSSMDYDGMKTALATATDGGGVSNVTQLGVAEEQEVYRWFDNDSGTTNPTLTFMVNRDNILQINNPTDTVHELKIELNGTEVAESEELGPKASTQVTFRPNMTGTFQYYCEYHPTTMRGMIEVTDS
jgi:plastocyanin